MFELIGWLNHFNIDEKCTISPGRTLLHVLFMVFTSVIIIAVIVVRPGIDKLITIFHIAPREHCFVWCVTQVRLQNLAPKKENKTS